MVAIQPSPTATLATPDGNNGTASRGNATATTPYGSGNGNGTNSTTANHNGTTFVTTLPFPTNFMPPPSSGGPSPPISSGIGVGLGVALGFAAVVILLVLWHIFTAGRQRRRERSGIDSGGADGANDDGKEQQSPGRRSQQQRHIEASSSSSLSSSALAYPGKGKQKAAAASAGNQQLEATKPQEMRETARDQEEIEPRWVRGRRRRAQGRGRGQRQQRLGGSRWERRDGHRQTADGTDLLKTNDAPAEAGVERPRFSFEGVTQGEDSIERISQARSAFLGDNTDKEKKGMLTRSRGETYADKERKPQEAKEGNTHTTPEKGDTARHIYEMEPY